MRPKTETSFLKANRRHATIYATGLVDLQAHRVIDMTLGNAAGDLRRCALACWRCDQSSVPEIRTLGRTLLKWFQPILARSTPAPATDRPKV